VAIKESLTIGQCAKICNVAAGTVVKWFDSNMLEGYRLPGSGDRRVTRSSLISFLDKHGISTPSQLLEGQVKPQVRKYRSIRNAYLVVICDKDTNAVLSAAIWSSPEWEQSQALQHRTYVAYQTAADTYADAEARLREHLKSMDRYKWLLEYLDKSI
jgi:hypothetical protein